MEPYKLSFYVRRKSIQLVRSLNPTIQFDMYDNEDSDEEEEEPIVKPSRKQDDEVMENIPPSPKHQELKVEEMTYRSIFVEESEESSDDDSEGGAMSEFPSITMTIVPDETEEFESKLRIGPNPSFNDLWKMRLTKVVLPRSGIRFRLYACILIERDTLLGEGIVPLSNFNMRIQTPMTVKLLSRNIPAIMVTEPESDGESTIIVQPANPTPFPSERAEWKPAHTLPSEMLVNASYSPTTGKYECVLQKARGFRVPGKLSEKPTTFVRLLLRDEDGTILGETQSKTVKKLHNPSFDETFVFSLFKSQVTTVTTVFTVYHKPSLGKKVQIGWLSMGIDNTSTVEEEHWEDIVSGKGQRIARWHTLFAPKTGSE